MEAIRPACCPVCGAASRPIGGGVVLQGHGLRSRQAWGPLAPEAQPVIQHLFIRRYRCKRCGAVPTVVPAETLTKRLYSAAAIAWALALFGLSMLAPSAVRKLVSPWRVVGPTAARRWSMLLRWCDAVAEGRLFRCVRVATSMTARRVAERAAATVATYALPSPDPPRIDALAFLGAARAP